MNPKDYIIERDKVTEAAVGSLDRVLPLVQREILKRVVNRLDDLETDSEGRILPTSENLKVINKIIRKEARAVFLIKEYEDAVMEFVGSFKELGKLTKQYFNKIESGRPTEQVT